MAWQCNRIPFPFYFHLFGSSALFFFTKEKISIFEVQEKALYSIATDYKGFITRDEQIVTLKNDAYVTILFAKD